MSDVYKPINCELHSLYERWVIRAEKIRLAWQGADGITYIERIIPLDVRAEKGEEFLYFKGDAQAQRRVRLDHIFRADVATAAVASQQEAG